MSTRGKKKAKPKVKKAPTKKAPAPKVSKTKKVAEEKPKKAAPRAKKPVERKEAPAKVAVKAEPMELGPHPDAMIASRHLDSMHERPARGFSFGELASAGVPLNAARSEGLHLDIRRRSVVEGNVEALKGWFKSPGGKPPRERATEPVAVPAAVKKK